jgi:probable F420-dependent oxidoreductase
VSRVGERSVAWWRHDRRRDAARGYHPRMDFGLCLPNFRDGSSAEGLDAAAEVAEQFGWSTVWTTDHVIVAEATQEEYGRVYEAILTLAWLGARHPRVRLGTSVIVVPQRNAVLLAKELAVLDSLSGGRVTAGIGVGWNTAEFANLGMSDRFHERGAYLDESIRLWRHLWSGSIEPFHGRFHTLDDFRFGPLPVQDPLPILIGGVVEPALRRAGTLADGFHASSTSPAKLAGMLPIVTAAAESAGRPAPSLSARARVRFLDSPDTTYALRGTPEDMAADIRAYTALGVGHVALSFEAVDPAGIVADAERFVREVVPLV